MFSRRGLLKALTVLPFAPLLKWLPAPKEKAQASFSGHMLAKDSGAGVLDVVKATLG